MITEQTIQTSCIHPYWQKLKKLRRRLFQVFLILGTMSIIVSTWILIRHGHYIEVLPTAMIVILIHLFGLGICLNLLKKKSYKQRFKVIEITDVIRLPESFKKKHRWIMHDLNKMYVINNQKIPAKFVEFVEGKRAYTVKPLLEIEHDMTYQLIYIFESSYALIRDQRKRKWIVNVDNLEPILD